MLNYLKINNRKKSSFLATLLLFLSIFSTPVFCERFFLNNHLITDLKNNVEWMRCTVGQRWNGTTCSGEVVPVSHDDIPTVVQIANEQLGEGWRLPTKDELLSLVCTECGIPTIDDQIFPNTQAFPYWTGEPNPFAPSSFYKHFFTINFYTGRPYGMFASYQSHMVRLLRDR